MKSTWKIIDNETRSPHQDTSPTMLNVNDTLIENQLIHSFIHSFIHLFSIPEIHQSGYRTCYSTINK
jgi:hypothetical protein